MCVCACMCVCMWQRKKKGKELTNECNKEEEETKVVVG